MLISDSYDFVWKKRKEWNSIQKLLTNNGFIDRLLNFTKAAVVHCDILFVLNLVQGDTEISQIFDI